MTGTVRAFGQAMVQSHSIQEAAVRRLESFSFGPYRVHPARREVHRNETLLPAPPKAFDLLVLLLTHRDRVLSHEELLRALWPRGMVSRGALPQTVLKVRKLLGGKAESEAWICSVRGVGYRFIGELSRGDEMPKQEWLSLEPPQRSMVSDTAIAHRVTAVHRRALELLIRKDYEGYTRTVAQLGDRTVFGSDLRARALSLLHQVWHDRAESYVKAWHTLQRAEQLVERIDCPIVKIAALQAKAGYLKQFVSHAEGLPYLKEARDVAIGLPDPLYAADCTFLIAGTFGGMGEASACTQWGDEAIALAAKVEPSFIRTCFQAATAGSRVWLGELAKERGETSIATEHFRSAQHLLEDAEADGDPDTLELLSTFIQASRALAEAHLDARSLTKSIDTYRVLLARDMRPLARLEFMLELGRILRDAGRLEEADEVCVQAKALAETSRSVWQRESLLLLAADLATRQGRHVKAIRLLHELLAHQKEAANHQAATVAKVTALRMETEQALAAARTERAIARQMRSENELLRMQAALSDHGHNGPVPFGELPPEAFWAYIAAYRSQVQLSGPSVWLAIVHFTEPDADPLTVTSQRGPGGTWSVSKHVAAAVRSTDRWSVIDKHCVAVAFSCDNHYFAELAAARLQREVARPSAPSARGHAVVDVTLLDIAQSDSDEIARWAQLGEVAPEKRSA